MNCPQNAPHKNDLHIIFSHCMLLIVSHTLV